MPKLQKDFTEKSRYLKNAFLRMVDDATPFRLMKKKLHQTIDGMSNWVAVCKVRGELPADYLPSEQIRRIESAKCRLLRKLGHTWDEMCGIAHINKATLASRLKDDDVIYGKGRIRMVALEELPDVPDGAVFDVVLEDNGEDATITIHHNDRAITSRVSRIFGFVKVVSMTPVADDFRYPLHFAIKSPRKSYQYLVGV